MPAYVTDLIPPWWAIHVWHVLLLLFVLYLWADRAWQRYVLARAARRILLRGSSASTRPPTSLQFPPGDEWLDNDCR